MWAPSGKGLVVMVCSVVKLLPCLALLAPCCLVGSARRGHAEGLELFEVFFASRYGAVETVAGRTATQASVVIQMERPDEGRISEVRIRLAADPAVVERRCREDLDCFFATVPTGGFVDEYYVRVARIWRRLATKASLAKMAEYMRACWRLTRTNGELGGDYAKTRPFDLVWQELSQAYLDLWWPTASEPERVAIMTSSLTVDARVPFHCLDISDRIVSLGEVARAPFYSTILAGRLREDVGFGEITGDDPFKPTRSEIDKMLHSRDVQVSDAGRGLLLGNYPNDQAGHQLVLADLASDDFGRVYKAVHDVSRYLNRPLESSVGQSLFRALHDRLTQIETAVDVGKSVVGNDAKAGIDVVAMAISALVDTRYAAQKPREIERHINWLEGAISALSKRRSLSPDYVDWPKGLRARLGAATQE